MRCPLIILFIFLVVSGALGAQEQFAVLSYGAEVLDPTDASHSYITSLRLDTIEGSRPRLWYTIDKMAPNIYFAEFQPGATGNGSFWTTAQSPYALNAASPFITFDVTAGNLAGVAYPIERSRTDFGLIGDSQIFQGGFVQPGSHVASQLNQSQAMDYEYYGVVLDRAGADFGQYLYMAGWAHDIDDANLGFSVARAKLRFDSSQLEFDEDDDIIYSTTLEADTNSQCYDIYTPNYKPFVFIKNPSQYIIVVFPGPCSRIFKINIPVNDSFRNAEVQVILPVDPIQQYIVSASFDAHNELLWFSTKGYQLSQVSIRAATTKTKLQLNPTSLTLNLPEADPLLTVAHDPDPQRGQTLSALIIAASGMSNVYRYAYKNDGSSLTFQSSASLADSWNKLSSALYHAPYYYFATFEPNAKLVRIHSASFCPSPCGEHSFCQAAACICAPGYSVDGKTKDGEGRLQCLPGYYRTIERQVQQQSGATGVLATLFAFSLVVGGAGWYLFWKARSVALRSV